MSNVDTRVWLLAGLADCQQAIIRESPGRARRFYDCGCHHPRQAPPLEALILDAAAVHP